LPMPAAREPGTALSAGPHPQQAVPASAPTTTP
jgi:hypothetical protein